MDPGAHETTIFAAGLILFLFSIISNITEIFLIMQIKCILRKCACTLNTPTHSKHSLSLNNFLLQIYHFQTKTAYNCAIGYFFFTGVSVVVYVFEIVDVCLTLKNDEENVKVARLAKSLVLVLEEVHTYLLV